MTAQQGVHNERQRGWWIPWLFVALFGVVLTANGTLLYFAMSSFTGLQTEGHYKKGLDYNRVLDAAQAQEALGWAVSISFEPAGGGNGKLTVRTTDSDGTPLSEGRVTARLIRPVQAGHDLDVILVPAGDGVYQADLSLPLVGQWEVQTRIEHRTAVYRTARRIVVR